MLARLRHCRLRVLVAGTGDPVDEWLARCGADGCDLAVETVPGDPVDGAEERGDVSDLVVLGRHRPLLGGLAVGRTGRTLLDDPVCPVLLTPPGHEHLTARRGRDGAARKRRDPCMTHVWETGSWSGAPISTGRSGTGR